MSNDQVNGFCNLIYWQIDYCLIPDNILAIYTDRSDISHYEEII